MEQYQTALDKAGIKSLASLGWKLRNVISISTSRRMFLGLSPISTRFVAASLTLLKPYGVRFDDMFEIEEES